MAGRLVSVLIALLFFAAALVRIDIPPVRVFDERHYVLAAGRLLYGMQVINREHPMLGKELIAASVALFGNTPLGWRFPSIVAGSVGLFASMRAMAAYRNETRAAVLGILIATSFLHLSLSRLAMLDVFSFCFCALATLAFVHSRLVFCGIALGLAVASKWSAAPVALAFGAWALYNRDWRTFLRMTLSAVVVYLATFIPGYLIEPMPDIFTLHMNMLGSLSAPLLGNPDTSVWWQWLIGQGHITLADGEIGGSYRFAELAVNPVASLCVIFGLFGARKAPAPAILFAACMAFWALNGKPYQYLYSFLLPLSFGLAVFAAAAPRWLGLTAGSAASLAFALNFQSITFGPIQTQPQSPSSPSPERSSSQG